MLGVGITSFENGRLDINLDINIKESNNTCKIGKQTFFNGPNINASIPTIIIPANIGVAIIEEIKKL